MCKVRRSAHTAASFATDLSLSKTFSMASPGITRSNRLHASANPQIEGWVKLSRHAVPLSSSGSFVNNPALAYHPTLPAMEPVNHSAPGKAMLINTAGSPEATHAPFKLTPDTEYQWLLQELAGDPLVRETLNLRTLSTLYNRKPSTEITEKLVTYYASFAKKMTALPDEVQQAMQRLRQDVLFTTPSQPLHETYFLPEKLEGALHSVSQAMAVKDHEHLLRKVFGNRYPTLSPDMRPDTSRQLTTLLIDVARNEEGALKVMKQLGAVEFGVFDNGTAPDADFSVLPEAVRIAPHPTKRGVVQAQINAAAVAHTQALTVTAYLVARAHEHVMKVPEHQSTAAARALGFNNEERHYIRGLLPTRLVYAKGDTLLAINRYAAIALELAKQIDTLQASAGTADNHLTELQNLRADLEAAMGLLSEAKEAALTQYPQLLKLYDGSPQRFVPRGDNAAPSPSRISL